MFLYAWKLAWIVTLMKFATISTLEQLCY